MQSFLRLSSLCFLILALLWMCLTANAQDAQMPVVDENTQPPAFQTNAQGVFPSLMYRGDIADFLRMLGIAAHRNIVPSPEVRGPVNVNLFNVSFDEALDIVLAANGYVREDTEAFVLIYEQQEYDQLKQSQRETESRAFELNYIGVSDVVALITPMLSDAGTITRSPDTTAGTSTADTWAGGNYIVVEDYPESLDRVAEMISTLDRRPQQVLVEATILAARINDRDTLGIDFRVLGGVDFQARVDTETDSVGLVPADDAIPLNGTEVNAELSNGSLSIGIVHSNIGMFIRAVESITDVVTIGNPKVMTLNRQQGEVRVGGEQGYVTSETTATSTTQSVENLETGTILRFRPFIMSDGYIRMELHAEDSSGEVVVKGDYALPEKVLAQVESNVLVQDGHTIVIGGLFRDTTTASRSQVPLLGEIPVLGPLFRSTTDQVQKEELIFLITPHIVDEPMYSEAGQRLLEEFDQRMIAAREGLQWHSRSRLAEARYQEALQYQAEGDLEKALYNANLAFMLSPTTIDYIHLRNELRNSLLTHSEFSTMRTFMRQIVTQDPDLVAPLPGSTQDISTDNMSVLETDTSTMSTMNTVVEDIDTTTVTFSDDTQTMVYEAPDTTSMDSDMDLAVDMDSDMDLAVDMDSDMDLAVDFDSDLTADLQSDPVDVPAMPEDTTDVTSNTTTLVEVYPATMSTDIDVDTNVDLDATDTPADDITMMDSDTPMMDSMDAFIEDTETTTIVWSDSPEPSVYDGTADTDADTEMDFMANYDSDFDTEVTTDAETDTEVTAEAETDTEVTADADTDTEVAADAETDTEVTADADADSDTAVEDNSNTDADEEVEIAQDDQVLTQ
ncbi:MAG: hypothetical protein JW936_04415 [Sedimentisphaerales bacterium]|nr:hypothetical protein [Sedimentisphaerales bacterium]